MPQVQTLLTGLAFGESPRWHEGRLWVADWGAQEILARKNQSLLLRCVYVIDVERA